MDSSTDQKSKNDRIRVGIIGCGQVAQVIHIPTLGFLQDLFRITYLCDVSKDATEFCRSRVFGGERPQVTKSVAELCSSPNVDVVFVLSSDEYHADQAITALQHDKHVLVEKPLALNLRDIDRIQAAEDGSKGKVMVGYMRRYASAFKTAVEQIGGIENVLYARVRDIIGPNETFVSQSGTFSKAFNDISESDALDRSQRAKEQVRYALESETGVSMSDENVRMWRYLGSLGTHDLSAMREAIGMPASVLGAHRGFPFWNVLFQYPGFAVSYESGINSVPKFDAHIEVYGQDKSVRIQYDTPYVKGLPITVHISENVNGALKSTEIRETYEDAYTQEMRLLYRWVKLGEPVKTTAQDARLDMKILQMIMGHNGDRK